MRRRHWKMAKRVWTLAAAFVLAFPGQTWAEVTPEGNVRNETDVLASSSLRSLRSFIISMLRELSRLPVGSSASSSFGLMTIARAIATRCC